MTEECGDSYGCFPLTKGEQQTINIGEEETEVLRGKGTKCLVGRLGNPKKNQQGGIQNTPFAYLEDD
jgi:hypothetical protein